MTLRAQPAGRLLTAGCIATLAAGVHAASAEVSAHVSLTSEYIYRGLSWSDDNPSLQAGLDYEHDSGFFAGLWAGTVDLSNPTGRRDVELDYYAGWHFVTDSPFSASVSLMHYTYPDNTGDIDYDYTEAVFTAAWNDSYTLELGYAEDLYGFDVTGRHAELRGNWVMPNAWVISAGLGYKDAGALAASSYRYWDAGASARFSRLTFDMRWYDNEAPGGFLDRLSAGSQVVATLTVAF
jgi:uncharacterized protein (TIGR02001 family)